MSVALGKRFLRSLQIAYKQADNPEWVEYGDSGRGRTARLFNSYRGWPRVFKLSLGCAKNACLRLLTWGPLRGARNPGQGPATPGWSCAPARSSWDPSCR